VRGNHAEAVSVAEIEIAELCLAKSHGVLQHRLEHRLQLAGRARNDLQHIGGRGLLRQRLAQLVKQARVLDGDEGLRSEVLEKLDLLVVERSDLLAVNDNRTDRFVFLEHRHSDVRPRATEPSRRIRDVLG